MLQQCELWKSWKQKTDVYKRQEQIELNERYAFMGFSDAEKCLFRRFMEQIITNISCIPEEKTENLQEKERLTSD